MIRFDILEVSNDEVGIMISEIVNGVLKEDSEIDFTDYKSELWDDIEAEISNLKVGEQLRIVVDLPKN